MRATAGRGKLTTERHHHFACTQCGAMTEFLSPEMDAIRPPGGVAEPGRLHSLRVELLGICRRGTGRAAAAR